MRKNLIITPFIKLIATLFWTGMWLFGLGLLAWYPMRWWPGDHFWPVQLLNYFMPWLLVGLLPALLVAILTQRRRLTLLLAIPLLLIITNLAPLFLPRSNPALADSLPFKVMSYNIWSHNHSPEAVAAVIQQAQPDILLLQEIEPWIAHRLLVLLTELYGPTPPHFIYNRDKKQAILSRYPLQSLATGYDPGRTQKALVSLPSGPITIWNVHPSQPILWRKHYHQIQTLVREQASVDTPLIVGGDFNTTDQAEAYRLISRYLTNAHWEAGWGFGFTFPAHRPQLLGFPIAQPMVRIDHIFVNDHFFVHQAGTLTTAGGSDHRPVIAELSLVK